VAAPSFWNGDACPVAITITATYEATTEDLGKEM